MRAKTFILNGKTALLKDYESPGHGLRVEFYGVEQLNKALYRLYEAGKMEGADLKQAIAVLKYHSKTIVRKLKALAPKSSRATLITSHRHFSKGQQTILKREHKPGELKRSMGTLTSKKWRKLPLIYVGARRGTKYKNSGAHAFIAEHGRKKITASPGKYLFFADKTGKVVKTKTAAGFTGRKFFKNAMDAEGDRAVRRIQESFAYFFGNIWESPKAHNIIKP